ncbi:MAG: glycerol-3-phosphate acyltransferase, partial [Thermodesulfobacteriota bacterium]
LAARWLFSGSVAWAGLAPDGTGLAAFLGHVFSPFLGFKGGKGVATALGVFLGLTPLSVLPAVVVFVAVTALTGYISAGSLSGAAVVPLAALCLSEPPRILVLTVVLAAVIFLRHRENIARLRRGEENKWRRKR